MSVCTKTLALALFAGLFAAGTVSAAEPTGAERHVARGVACTSCHGADMKSPEYPDETQCTACHNREALIAKTKDIQPTNPHAAPHNGDCTLCHLQHEAPVDYCAQCHKFDFKVR